MAVLDLVAVREDVRVTDGVCVGERVPVCVREGVPVAVLDRV